MQIIRKNKKEYYEQNIDKRKTNPIEMWKTIKELIGNKKSTNAGTKEINFKDKQYKDEKTIANEFNEFFIQSIEEIIGDEEDTERAEDRIEIKGGEELSQFEEITYRELDKIIRNLEDKKGTDEGITTRILKMAWKCISEEIIIVVNGCIKEGICPDSWKTSTVVPIPKIRGSKKAEDHRPINILPNYEKVLEIVIKNQLCKYLDQNEILIEAQSGFREKHSCETAIQNTLISWREYLDKSEMIGVVFLDFKRAFETVNRNLLLRKLNNYGITDKAYKWFEMYLNNRKQQVKYRNAISVKKDTIHGVPQRSVLGSLLFVLYINDIVKAVKYCTCKLFADDTMIYISGRDLNEIERKLNYDLGNIVKWLDGNSMRLNTNKTKFMLIYDPRKRCTRKCCNIVINGERLEEVCEIKYLGIIIDNHLQFNSHADYTAKKIAKKVNFLYRLNKYVSSYTMVTVYKSIIAPHFEYCNTIMLNFSENSMSVMQKAQNRAMRAILRCNRFISIRQMLDALSFMTAKERMLYNICIFVHKMVCGMMPQYLLREVEFVKEVHNYNTRQKESIKITYCRTNTGQKTVTYKGYQIYNRLPKKIRDTNNLNEFKKSLSKKLKNREYYTV